MRTLEGVGIGLRSEFARELIVTERRVDFVEIVPENWLDVGGAHRALLDRYRERWPVVPHSVSLSIGGPDPLDDRLFDAMHDLCTHLDAPFWSDHVAYARAGGAYRHDLLPLPFSEEALEHVVARIALASTWSPVPLVLENPTYYSRMPGSTFDEASFLSAIFERSGCGMLLDVNNVYVNARNHGTDPRAVIDALPMARVEQIHLAGHTERKTVVLDTHAGPIADAVWELYRYALARAGRMIPTLIEWDTAIPAVDVILDEVDRARDHAHRALSPGLAA